MLAITVHKTLWRFNLNELLCASFGLKTSDVVEGSEFRLRLRLVVAASVQDS